MTVPLRLGDPLKRNVVCFDCRLAVRENAFSARAGIHDRRCSGCQKPMVYVWGPGLNRVPKKSDVKGWTAFRVRYERRAKEPAPSPEEVLRNKKNGR